MIVKISQNNPNQGYLISALLVFFTLLSSLLLTNISCASDISSYFPNWSVKVVDDTRNATNVSSSIAIDSSNSPHISYFYCEKKEIKYSKYNKGKWETITVDRSQFQLTFTSLAIDKNDNPHIIFTGLKHAWFDGSKWQVETIDTQGDIGNDHSIVIDDSNKIYVSYYDRSTNELKYAWKTNNKWNIEVINTGEVVGVFPSIAIDSKKNPHICFFDPSLKELKYTWKNVNKWGIITLDPNLEAGLVCLIGIDSKDQVFILYNDALRDQIKYVKFEKKIIESGIVSNGVRTCMSMIIGANQPSIVYQTLDIKPNSDRIVLASRDNISNKWMLETIYQGPLLKRNTTYGPSLSIAANTVATFISFKGESDGSLYCISMDMPSLDVINQLNQLKNSYSSE